MSSGAPAAGAKSDDVPAQPENNVPHVADSKKTDPEVLASNVSLTTDSQPSSADVLPASQISDQKTNRIQLPVPPVPKPDYIQLSDVMPVMQAVFEIASKHVDISRAATGQLFENKDFMAAYEAGVDTYRETTEWFTKLLMRYLPRKDSVDHGCQVDLQPTTTRDDTSQSQPQTAMGMDAVEATRERSSNGSERGESSNVTLNSAIANSIAADSHTDGDAGKRACNSAAGPSAKRRRRK